MLNHAVPYQRRYPRGISRDHQAWFLPTSMAYESAPQRYQRFSRSQYHNLQHPPRRRLRAIPSHRAYNSRQAVIQTQSRYSNICPQSFDITEPPWPRLDITEPASPDFPSRASPTQVPIYPSIEEVLSNDGWSEPAGQIPADNLDLDMLPIPETCEQGIFDAPTATVPTASPPTAVCCSCGEQWMRLVTFCFAIPS